MIDGIAVGIMEKEGDIDSPQTEPIKTKDFDGLGEIPKTTVYVDTNGPLSPRENFPTTSTTTPENNQSPQEKQDIKSRILEDLQDVRDEEGSLKANTLVKVFLRSGGTLQEIQAHFSSTPQEAEESGKPYSPEVASVLEKELERSSVLETLSSIIEKPTTQKEGIKSLLQSYHDTYHEDVGISKALESITDPNQWSKIQEAQQEIREEQRAGKIEQYTTIVDVLLKDTLMRGELTEQLTALNKPETEKLLSQYNIPPEDWKTVTEILQNSLRKAEAASTVSAEETEAQERMTGKKILGFGILLLADVAFNNGYGTEQLLSSVLNTKILFPTLKKLGFSDKVLDEMRLEGSLGYSPNGELLRLPSHQLSEIILSLRKNQIFDIVRSLPTQQERVNFVKEGQYRNQRLSKEAVEAVQRAISKRDSTLLGVELDHAPSQPPQNSQPQI